MSPACTFALFLLIATIVSCNADPLLIAREPSLPCLSFECPATDLAFYPLAPDLSGPKVDAGVSFIHCYYPFLSNCQYILSTGVLAADIDDGACPQIAVQSNNCASPPCYNCPPHDNLNYQLGSNSGAFGPILFCPYPTPTQPYVAVYYCNYGQADGSLYYDGDNEFCPQTAPHANASTPYCPSHSAVMDSITLTPTTLVTASSPATTSGKVIGATTPGPRTSSRPIPSGLTGSGSSLPALNPVNLRLQIIGTTIITVIFWLTFSLAL